MSGCFGNARTANATGALAAGISSWGGGCPIGGHYSHPCLRKNRPADARSRPMPTNTPPTRPKNGTFATYQNPSAQHPSTINVAPAPRNVLERPNCAPSVAKCHKTLSTRRRSTLLLGPPPPSNPAQQRRGSEKLEVPETNHTPQTATVGGSVCGLLLHRWRHRLVRKFPCCYLYSIIDCPKPLGLSWRKPIAHLPNRLNQRQQLAL